MDYKELIDRLSEWQYSYTAYLEKDLAHVLGNAIDAIETLMPERDADRWISVEEGLPKQKDDFERYNVTVMRSHFPTSTYDICDSPYDEEFVTTASYDSSQKIWHLDCDECLNALIGIEDAPLNGDFVTHWKPLPAPPACKETEGEA